MAIDHNEEWLDLTNVIHTNLERTLGGCPEHPSGGWCHEIADAVLEAGWRRPAIHDPHWDPEGAS